MCEWLFEGLGCLLFSQTREGCGLQESVGLRVSVRLSTYGGRTHRPIRVCRKYGRRQNGALPTS